MDSTWSPSENSQIINNHPLLPDHPLCSSPPKLPINLQKCGCWKKKLYILKKTQIFAELFLVWPLWWKFAYKLKSVFSDFLWIILQTQSFSFRTSRPFHPRSSVHWEYCYILKIRFTWIFSFKIERFKIALQSIDVVLSKVFSGFGKIEIYPYPRISI